MDNSASIVYNEKSFSEFDVYLLAGSTCCNEFEQITEEDPNGEPHDSVE